MHFSGNQSQLCNRNKYVCFVWFHMSSYDRFIFHNYFLNEAGEARKGKWERKEKAKKARANSIKKAANTPAFNTYREFAETLDGVNEAGRPRTDKQKFDLCWAQLLRIKTLTDSKFKHRQKKQIKPKSETWSNVKPRFFALIWSQMKVFFTLL